MRTYLTMLFASALAFTPISLAQSDSSISVDDVIFGDDAGNWAGDGECDDPRFAGAGMTSTTLLDDDMFHDASDCRAHWASGFLSFAGTPTVDDINFGDDSSIWADDDECDDPRFAGATMAETLVEEDMYADASDCSAAYEAGKITLAALAGDTSPTSDSGSYQNLPPSRQTAPSTQPSHNANPLANPAPSTPSSAGAGPNFDGIDFGDDSSLWAFDDECDDPRFMGDNAATTLLHEDLYADATDCLAAYKAGMIEWNEDWEAALEIMDPEFE